jgi:hypothetical protein
MVRHYDGVPRNVEHRIFIVVELALNNRKPLLHAYDARN